MRSSPDLKVKIPAVAGRSCAGAPWGPCPMGPLQLAEWSFRGGPRFLQGSEVSAGTHG
jgi:hypothetical protein